MVDTAIQLSNILVEIDFPHNLVDDLVARIKSDRIKSFVLQSSQNDLRTALDSAIFSRLIEIILYGHIEPKYTPPDDRSFKLIKGLELPILTAAGIITPRTDSVDSSSYKPQFILSDDGRKFLSQYFPNLVLNQ